MKSMMWLVALFFAATSAWAQTPAGDATKGKKHYETLCALCHSLTENKVGPSHKGVFGRKAGTVAGFNYSAGFAKLDLVWNEKRWTRGSPFRKAWSPDRRWGST